MPGESSQALEGSPQLYLSTLPSLQFYNDVNKDHPDLWKYSNQCDKIIVSKTDEVKEVCKKYLKYLDNSYTIWNEAKNGYDICILMNYWIYGTLTGIYSSEKTSDNIDIAFGNFQLVWDNLVIDSIKRPFYERCKPHYEMFSHKDWEKRKELYEYYVDYNSIKLQNDTYPQNCKTYYEYIKKKAPLYEYFDDLCSNEQTKCPTFYKECEEYNPKIVLPDLHCHEQMEQEEDSAQALLMPHDSRQGLGSEAHEHGPGVLEPPAPSDTVSAQENSGIGTKVGHSVLGVAPVLLTATALYRYTPVGSWIRKFGGLQNNISDMDGGEMDGFLSHTQVSDDIFLNNTENYISYQPM
ncbi:PIR Superfamily Protein [Plasmodium ovale wallikeri]|uniref:PIR Superfamily Protein n=1 Tax=Plasmodium ovale wallikeri TaxID=864142 RepID=A0A1A9AFD6_PLAOA|nr:PIR Superfamily Protein [Plasmodium ovale wallikeri]